MTTEQLQSFFDLSLAGMPDAASRYSMLAHVMTRPIDVNGFTVTVQHNPSRAISTNAKVDASAIAKRPCFLCARNRPASQPAISLHEGRYELLVNPFPIMPLHLTIPSVTHTPQAIKHRLDDMIYLVNQLPGMAVFYNGPSAGASAPDHFHFQAVPVTTLPLLASLDKSPFIIEEISCESDLLPEKSMNLIAWHDGSNTRVIKIPRRAHRPECYHRGRLIISPGAIDMAGVIVAPRLADYRSITADDIEDILKQVAYERKA